MLFLGSDHGGFSLKKELIEYLEKEGQEVIDLGCDNEESVDYPLFGRAVAKEVVLNEGSLGIVICGTGIGISLAANKVEGARAALCTNGTMARLSREHNNANILALGARIVGGELAKDIVKIFLKSTFEGGRHERRVGQIEETS